MTDPEHEGPEHPTAPQSTHLLANGALAHVFTDEDRAKGGRARAEKIRAEKAARGEKPPRRRRRRRSRWSPAAPPVSAMWRDPAPAPPPRSFQELSYEQQSAVRDRWIPVDVPRRDEFTDD